jgi:hypothetical protein
MVRRGGASFRGQSCGYGKRKIINGRRDWGVIPRTVLRIWETENYPCSGGLGRHYADSPADKGNGNYPWSDGVGRHSADSPADMGN